jgi:hypothetical protein
LRAATAIVLAFVVAACSGRAGPSAAVWGSRVPEAGAEAVANQPVVAQHPNSFTLLPISPSGAVVGVAYGYDMPHCGILSPIDVEGTFWDAVGIAPDSVDFDGQAGTFRLLSHDQAEFTATDGRVLHLVRHQGAKAFRGCA